MLLTDVSEMTASGPWLVGDTTDPLDLSRSPRGITLQVTASGSGMMIAEGSNDAKQWLALVGVAYSSGLAVDTLDTSKSQAVSYPAVLRFFRLRCVAAVAPGAQVLVQTAGIVFRPAALAPMAAVPVPWSYPAKVGGVSSTAVQLVRGAVTGQSHYVQALSVDNSGLLAAEVTLSDGSGALFRGFLPTGTGKQWAFPVALKAQGALSVTASALTALYINLSGYTQ